MNVQKWIPGLVLATAISLGAGSSQATDRMVGVVPGDGPVTLLKRFSVPGGTTILGAEFSNNDPNTIFPEVLLVRDLSIDTSAGMTVASVGNVREMSRGVVQVFWTTPVLAVAGSDYFVGVQFPLGVRKDRTGVGPAIGAYDASDPVGSYVTTIPGEPLLPVRVDLDIRLLTGGSAKAENAPAGSEKSPEMAGSRFFLAMESPFRTDDPRAISFGLERPGAVRLEIYNVSGRRVRALVRADLPAGTHQVAWDGRDESGVEAARGLYFLHLQADGRTLTRKFVLAR